MDKQQLIGLRKRAGFYGMSSVNLMERRVRRSPVFAAILCAVGCSSVPRQPSVTLSPSAAMAPASLYARVPMEIGLFKLTERTAVQGAPVDSLFRYKDSSAMLLSVIIYDVPPDVKAVADSQMWSPREGEKFREVQRIQRDRGRIGDYVIAFSDTATLNVGRSRIVEHAIASPTRFPNGRIAVEMQYLYVIAGRFVKVRVTVPEANWEKTPIRSFARELARLLAGGG